MSTDIIGGSLSSSSADFPYRLPRASFTIGSAASSSTALYSTALQEDIIQ